jgi:hypothetical protein
MADALQDLRQESREAANLAARLRDICGDDEQAFTDTLDGETEAVEAARRVVRWIAEQQAQEGACKGLAETYKARASVFSERQERARVALFHFLTEMGQKSMPLPEGTLSIVAGRVKVEGEPDVDLLPDRLVRVKREPDKAAIKAALEAGEIVRGCSLSNNAPTLMIRVR